eukprot:TRINITY_DN14157_c0_g1_i2.p1 TRINITY_DN14157_c0_g1~~TRINITY_DN14157_c0_g1_i2.p1  ORF type:complete len:455 (-),score=107.24 TRINITY_DN14157_c0_g1_i2:297-1661(-)
MQRLQSSSQKLSVVISLWFTLAETAIILDDQDTTLERQMANAHEGSYQPCMEDAYGGNFHHDWARTKGQSEFSMTFDPPESGCYSIEERHPGSNPSCAHYLPRNAQLTVDYCRGLSSNLVVDQSTRGGQWNHLANFMFYKGSKGKITMRNSPEEVCDADNCFWVVDAFRLTRLGSSCANVDEEKAQELTEQASPEMDKERNSDAENAEEAAVATQVGNNLGMDDEETAREGLITLRLEGSTDSGRSDFVVALNANIAGIETVLAAHFGYEEAKVREVVPFSRRLSAASAGTFRISFALSGAPTKQDNAPGDDLAQKLSVALAPAGVQVMSAGVQWVKASPELRSDESGNEREWSTTLVMMVAIGVATLALVLGALSFAIRSSRCACFRAQRVTEQAEQGNVVVVQAKEKEDDTSEIASVSTDDAGMARSSTVSSEPSLSGDTTSKEEETVHAVV